MMHFGVRRPCIGLRGLEGGDDDGFGGFVDGRVRFFLFALDHALEELSDGAFASCGLAYFGGWGEEA
jgi:hypothetical protein